MLNFLLWCTFHTAASHRKQIVHVRKGKEGEKKKTGKGCEERRRGTMVESREQWDLHATQHIKARDAILRYYSQGSKKRENKNREDPSAKVKGLSKEKKALCCYEEKEKKKRIQVSLERKKTKKELKSRSCWSGQSQSVCLLCMDERRTRSTGREKN